jgi:hypothetical protein
MRMYVFIMGGTEVGSMNTDCVGIRARMRSSMLLRRQVGDELSSSGRFSLFAMMQHWAMLLDLAEGKISEGGRKNTNESARYNKRKSAQLAIGLE